MGKGTVGQVAGAASVVESVSNAVPPVPPAPPPVQTPEQRAAELRAAARKTNGYAPPVGSCTGNAGGFGAGAGALYHDGRDTRTISQFNRDIEAAYK